MDRSNGITSLISDGCAWFPHLDQLQWLLHCIQLAFVITEMSVSPPPPPKKKKKKKKKKRKKRSESGRQVRIMKGCCNVYLSVCCTFVVVVVVFVAITARKKPLSAFCNVSYLLRFAVIVFVFHFFPININPFHA